MHLIPFEIKLAKLSNAQTHFRRPSGYQRIVTYLKLASAILFLTSVGCSLESQGGNMADEARRSIVGWTGF
jgi:hypothetical protein